MTPEVAKQVNIFLWVHLGELLCILAALVVGIWLAWKFIKQLRAECFSLRSLTVTTETTLEVTKQTRDLCQQILQKVQPPPSTEGTAHLDIPIGPVTEQR